MSNTPQSNKIHCPKCAKPLISQVAISEGTRFVMRCFYCGAFVKIIGTFNIIHKRVLQDPREVHIIREAKDQLDH